MSKKSSFWEYPSELKLFHNHWFLVLFSSFGNLNTCIRNNNINWHCCSCTTKYYLLQNHCINSFTKNNVGSSVTKPRILSHKAHNSWTGNHHNTMATSTIHTSINIIPYGLKSLNRWKLWRTKQTNKQTTLLITQTDCLQTNWKPLLYKRKPCNNGFKYISEYSLPPLLIILRVSNLVPRHERWRQTVWERAAEKNILDLRERKWEDDG
jgi:hypothetical protein